MPSIVMLVNREFLRGVSEVAGAGAGVGKTEIREACFRHPAGSSILKLWEKFDLLAGCTAAPWRTIRRVCRHPHARPENTLSDFSGGGCLVSEMLDSSNAQLLRDAARARAATAVHRGPVNGELGRSRHREEHRQQQYCIPHLAKRTPK